MNTFERKYGLKEDEKTAAFHRSRRMFCIYQDRLYIAKENLPYSHAVWFEKKGWISKEIDELMNEMARGIRDSKGDVYFYTGYDFKINPRIETVFFSHLGELVKKLKLQPDARIFGGLIKQEAGKIWLPIKKYGSVKDYLSC
jgi:hypothetical protein